MQYRAGPEVAILGAVVGDLIVFALDLLVLVTAVFVAVPLLAVWLLRRDRRVGQALTGVVTGLLGLLALAHRSLTALACATLLLLAVRYRPVGAGSIVRDRTAPLRRRVARIDPGALPVAWARPLREALEARRRFAAAVRRAGRGALRERMTELAADVDRALLHARDRARRGSELEAAARALPAPRRADALRGMVARAAEGWPGPLAPQDQRLVAARDAQVAARDRLLRAAAEERVQLQVIVARLDEASCAAAELAAGAPTGLPMGAPAGIGQGDGDGTAELLDRLAALRGALTEATVAAR